MQHKKRLKTARQYSGEAERYEKKWRGYLNNTHRKMLNLLNVRTGDRILDLSCGTGLLGYELDTGYNEFSELVLNDISEGMLETAAKRREYSERICFRQSDAAETGLEEHSFDIIISLNAFHNYDRQDTVLKEVYRLLKPGGEFYLLDWNKASWFTPLNAVIDLTNDQHIQTRSLNEMLDMLPDYKLDVETSESWRYRYWNLYCLKARYTV